MTTLIIGGGWSGLAAAVTLVQQGHPVHLIESAKQLGGRARNVSWHGHVIDNGQHLMIGAYQHMLDMMALVGISAEDAFDRYTIDITLYDTFFPPLILSAKNWLPWPFSLAWNLIASAGLTGFYQVVKLHSHSHKLLSGDDMSVSDWLLLTKQSERLIKQLWVPLCLATLNTPITEASAHRLATVLQESLGRRKSAADSLIPRMPLGDLFPIAAANFIKQHGGKISLQTRAKKLLIEDNKVQGIICQDGHKIIASNLIVATSPSHCADLLSPYLTINKPIEYPISTVYLQYTTTISLPSPMIGMTGTISQWVFDRSAQSPGQLAVVISAPGEHEKLTKSELVSLVSKELHHMLPYLPEQASDSLVIREKRATFACTVNIEQERPLSETTISGLWLAGDFVANGYPATLEGAVRNGQHCAKLLLTK
ncbi:MAG: hydroxysqualene dehydroxylase HpnE [Pseudomonadota bacterium]|nr:hydroxysqualene dehydroxylase HpnE [Pseudomonadota bacterium]MDO7710598.1 hydroxysqualene dehydroxylase HpnE [Pseudomonadota bacterium]